MKKIYLLIGPKGSGKSFIGELMQKDFGIFFFRVENVWRQLDQSEKDYVQQGFNIVIKEINRLFKTRNALTIESLGLTPHFNHFLSHLKKTYDVKLIQVYAPLNVCLKRIATRDSSIHIPISDDRIIKLNEDAAKVKLPYDLTLDNSSVSSKELSKTLSNFLSTIQHYV